MALSVEQVKALKSWPFEEALALLARAGKKPENTSVVFETGYGPSGLPHIGTFQEVARTAMVRHAFGLLSAHPSELICFSDDMDGLRKAPDNVPSDKVDLRDYIGQPLSAIPDPFGTHESYAAHNNARLRAFLDRFGFSYHFLSATECYRSGRFDATLLTILRHYEEVTAVILPTLGDERRRSYSPFLPVCAKTGRVLQAPVEEVRAEEGVIIYRDEEGGLVETPVTGGRCKMQWKADWAMRWAALGVDYEMYGKDLTPSAQLSSRICRIIGGTPPAGFPYELFLDEEGKKISKSKGNGLSIEEWLAYAPEESLSLYSYQAPRKAKRLFFDVIPKAVDEYLTFCARYHEQAEQAGESGEETAQQLANPAWHIHGGPPTDHGLPVSFGLLLNLASACNPEDKDVLWGFITRYAPEATPQSLPFLDRLAGYAVQYYRDFIRPHKQFRLPTPTERAALEELATALSSWSGEADAESVQAEIYRIGRERGFEPMKHWFSALYEVLLGQKQGPRMGSFILLYGFEETIALIREKLAEESPPDAAAL